MIALAPLPHDRVADVLHLLVGAGQDIFVHPIAEMVTDRVPGVAFHAARRDGGRSSAFSRPTATMPKGTTSPRRAFPASGAC